MFILVLWWELPQTYGLAISGQEPPHRLTAMVHRGPIWATGLEVCPITLTYLQSGAEKVLHPVHHVGQVHLHLGLVAVQAALAEVVVLAALAGHHLARHVGQVLRAVPAGPPLARLQVVLVGRPPVHVEAALVGRHAVHLLAVLVGHSQAVRLLGVHHHRLVHQVRAVYSYISSR